MRSPDSIRVLLQLRSHKEDLEGRRLSAIIEKLKLAQSELANVSTELNCITSGRSTEIQCTSPNIRHQEIEIYSNSLWKKAAGHSAEIERLRQAYAQQMWVYLSVRRDRETMATLEKQRT